MQEIQADVSPLSEALERGLSGWLTGGTSLEFPWRLVRERSPLNLIGREEFECARNGIAKTADQVRQDSEKAGAKQELFEQDVGWKLRPLRGPRLRSPTLRAESDRLHCSIALCHKRQPLRAPSCL